MTGRALLLALLAAGFIGAVPAAACTIRPPATTPEGRAEEARRARERQAELDRAVVFVGVVDKSRFVAVTNRSLRGAPPARIELGRTTCDPVWTPGQRLVIYARRDRNGWIALRAVPDTTAARAAVRSRPAPTPR